jgi:hypothetical protein
LGKYRSIPWARWARQPATRLKWRRQFDSTRSEIVERQACAHLVVGDRNAGRYPFMYHNDVGAVACLNEGRGHRHLAA